MGLDQPSIINTNRGAHKLPIASTSTTRALDEEGIEPYSCNYDACIQNRVITQVQGHNIQFEIVQLSIIPVPGSQERACRYSSSSRYKALDAISAAHTPHVATLVIMQVPLRHLQHDPVQPRFKIRFNLAPIPAPTALTSTATCRRALQLRRRLGLTRAREGRIAKETVVTSGREKWRQERPKMTCPIRVCYQYGGIEVHI